MGLYSTTAVLAEKPLLPSSNQARHDACLLNAIHAAISAADAVTVVLAGRRSADPDHQRAADLLEEMGASTPASKERVRQLRALLSLSTRTWPRLPSRSSRSRSSFIGTYCYHMASKAAIAFASTQGPAREPLTGVSDAASEQARNVDPGI